MQPDGLMTFPAFQQSLTSPTPPPDLLPALLALWHDGRGDWARAHDVAQEIDDETGSWVHAYLHRKEGDEANARYWYRRAGVAPAAGPLDEEWCTLVETLLVTPR